MSKATKGLRRAGIGGLTAAVALGTVVASAGGAFAFTSTAGDATLTSSGTTTQVYPGQTAQDAGSFSIAIKDASGLGFKSGEFIDVTLTNASGAALCDTSGNLNKTLAFTSLPTVAAVTGASDSAFAGVSASLRSTANCSGQDVLRIAFTADAPNDAATTTVKVSGVKLNVGSAQTASTVVDVTAVTSNGKPFADSSSAAIDTAMAQIAVVANAYNSGPSPVGTNLSATDVKVGNVVTTWVNGAPDTKIFYTLNNAKWSADVTDTAKVAGPSGVTVGTVSRVSDTELSVTVGSADKGVYTLSGATIDTPALSGIASVSVSTDATGATAVGDDVNVAGFSAYARVGGLDRYATAAQLFGALADGGTLSNAVLASGETFADALSGNYLAANKSTGLLLTAKGSLPDATKNALIDAGVSTVYIVGGTAAVSSAVADAVAATHVAGNSTNPTIRVIRIAGADRYATSKAVDLYGGVAATSTAVVATGEGFADALAVGPAVYAKQFPLVLTATNNLSSDAKDTLVNLGVNNVVIVGGAAAVSSAVEAQIKALGISIVRISGDDRTETAAQVANWETSLGDYAGSKGLGFFSGASSYTVHVARGDAFADALAAGPVAGATKTPIVLSASATAAGNGFGDFFPNLLTGLNTTKALTVNALGLTAAVSIPTQRAAAGALAD